MTGQAYRKCERCHTLYPVEYNYEPVMIPDRQLASVKFVNRSDIYYHYDLCFDCLDEFWVLWEKFMTTEPDDSDLEEQAGDI